MSSTARGYLIFLLLGMVAIAASGHVSRAIGSVLLVGLGLASIRFRESLAVGQKALNRPFVKINPGERRGHNSFSSSGRTYHHGSDRLLRTLVKALTCSCSGLRYARR